MQPSDDKTEKLMLAKSENEVNIKVYKRRWIILVLYIMYSAVNAFQWFEYSIVSNVIMKYYKISSLEVDWTAIIYTILYMPMVIPASYLISKVGLRNTVLIGCLGTTIGTTVKTLSFERNSIWLIYLGQTILSSMQVFILALPPRLAIVWFGPKQVSLACCLGVFGTQLGQALGLLVPPMVIKDHEDINDIGCNIATLSEILAGFILCVLAVIIIFFPSQPHLPPSIAQLKERLSKSNGVENTFSQTLSRVMKDGPFLLHAFAYGISVGIFIAVSTLLNEIMLMHFEDSEEDAGKLGLLSVVSGMIGSVTFGYILDKTHLYRETAIGLYGLSAMALLLQMFLLYIRSLIGVYVSGILFGLAVNTYTPVGLELATEMTYPEPEYTTSGILMSMTQTCGVLFTLLLGFLLRTYGLFVSFGVMVFFLVVGTVMTIMLPDRKRRQSALSTAMQVRKDDYEGLTFKEGSRR